jgi:hypothetical protein
MIPSPVGRRPPNLRFGGGFKPDYSDARSRSVPPARLATAALSASRTKYLSCILTPEFCSIKKLPTPTTTLMP